MEPQYCGKLGSRWQTSLQQYGGLTLKLPWLLPSCLICLSLMLFQCDVFRRVMPQKCVVLGTVFYQENFLSSLVTLSELIN